MVAEVKQYEYKLKELESVTYELQATLNKSRLEQKKSAEEAHDLKNKLSIQLDTNRELEGKLSEM